MNDNEEFENMFGELKSEGLSAEERDAMRTRISLFMKANPARAPFYIHALDSVLGIFSSPAQFSFARGHRFQMTAAVLALVLVIGVGTSYAAQTTVPGDLLYPIKIHVTEPIQGALATSASAQADWNAQVAARRLGEAETLAAQGKLSTTVESDLATALDQATDNFDTDVSQLAQTPQNAPTVADAQSAMEATLAVHAQILNQLNTAVPQSRAALAPLLARVQSQEVAVGNARAATDQVVAASTGAAVQADAETTQGDAEGALSAARVLVAQTSSATSAPAVSDAFMAEQAIGAGDEKLAQGDYGAALATFQSAVLDANEAQMHISAEDQLKNQTGISLPAATTTASASSTAALSATTTSATSTTSEGSGL
jgi:hypothetical protein